MCFRADKETAARITEEIGNLMKEIETLVEEKKKDSSDMAMMVAPQDTVQSDGEMIFTLFFPLFFLQNVLARVFFFTSRWHCGI